MSTVVEDCLDRLAKAAAGIRGAQEALLKAQNQIFVAHERFARERSRLCAWEDEQSNNLKILQDIIPLVMARFVENEDSEVDSDRLYAWFAMSCWDIMYGEGNNDEAVNVESHALGSDAPSSRIGLQPAPGLATSAAVPKPMSAPAAVVPKGGNDGHRHHAHRPRSRSPHRIPQTSVFGERSPEAPTASRAVRCPSRKPAHDSR